MKKRIISIIFIISLLLSFFSIDVLGYSEEHYIVLALETGGGHEFDINGKLEYTAVSPIEYTKKAAKSFIDAMLSNNSNARIAVVSYDENSQIIANFTGDRNQLHSAIDN